jgi:hypothetical protein
MSARDENDGDVLSNEQIQKFTVLDDLHHHNSRLQHLHEPAQLTAVMSCDSTSFEIEAAEAMDSQVTDDAGEDTSDGRVEDDSHVDDHEFESVTDAVKSAADADATADESATSEDGASEDAGGGGGAYFIPPDTFPADLTDAEYRAWIAAANLPLTGPILWGPPDVTAGGAGAGAGAGGGAGGMAVKAPRKKSVKKVVKKKKASGIKTVVKASAE